MQDWERAGVSPEEWEELEQSGTEEEIEEPAKQHLQDWDEIASEYGEKLRQYKKLKPPTLEERYEWKWDRDMIRLCLCPEKKNVGNGAKFLNPKNQPQQRNKKRHSKKE